MRTLMAAALLAAAAAPAGAQSIPIMEFNLGLANYNATYSGPPAQLGSRSEMTAWGGSVGGKFSLLGLLTRRMSDGKFFVGDQIGVEMGGIFWDAADEGCTACGEGAIRMHFEFAAAGGMRLNNGMAVIARLGVMGEDDTGGAETGWGSTFVSGRADFSRYSVELGAGPGGGDNTGMIYGNGRFYLGANKYLGARVQQATRNLEDSPVELKERSFMLYFGIDR